MDIRPLLAEMVARGGSDLYITTNSPPLVRAEGNNHPIRPERYTEADTEALANALMNGAEKAVFAESKELNLAIQVEDIGRFRVNVHRQRDAVGIVIRHIKTKIPTLDELHLPADLKEIILRKRGLVLVTGATGSGKSTSLAAMLDHRNDHVSGHVVTIEDPIEFIHPNKQSIFTQREVGLDTLSFNHALKNALRQAPDVILIGEAGGCKTFDQALLKLYADGRISSEEALAQADYPNDLRLQLLRVVPGTEPEKDTAGVPSISPPHGWSLEKLEPEPSSAIELTGKKRTA